MEINDSIKYYSVSEVNDIIHEIFINEHFFHNIAIRGEVSNYKGPNKSGHFYFTLKDNKSQISAVIFKFDSYNIKDQFKNGDDIIAIGDISSYSIGGTYQIIIRDLMLFGQGKLLLEKEKLKKKLISEGIFDASHKLELPKYPINIAIITGKNSAAAKDFEYNILRRWPISNLFFYSCLVQGEKAPTEIINALKTALKNMPDLIIIGRGGGAEDDLNAFDNESLIRFIYKEVNIPIISAVGHEINSTFTDYVCDKHASTPTGACEIAVPDYQEFMSNLDFTLKALKDRINIKINDLFLELSKIKTNPNIVNFNNIIDSKINYVDKIDKLITKDIIQKFKLIQQKIDSIKILIDKINPYNLLKIGYSIVKNKDSNILSSIKEVNVGDKLKIILENGDILVKVEEVKNGRKEEY